MRAAAGALALAAIVTGCGEAPRELAALSPLGTSPLDPEVQPLEARGDFAACFVEERPNPYHRVVAYDAANAGLEVALQLPDDGFLSALDLSPTGGQLALAYVPPPGESADYSTAGLFRGALGTGELELLRWPAEPDERYAIPTWHPDGESIYAVYVANAPLGEVDARIERLSLTGDSLGVVADGATEPALSQTGERLAFVRIGQTTGTRNLVIADADGSNPRVLVADWLLPGISNPTFDPTGDWIYFATDAPAEDASDVAVKHGGHDSPADWYRIPATGGAPELVLSATAPFHDAAISPAGDALLITTALGLFAYPLGGGDPQHHVFSRALRSLAVRW